MTRFIMKIIIMAMVFGGLLAGIGSKLSAAAGNDEAVLQVDHSFVEASNHRSLVVTDSPQGR